MWNNSEVQENHDGCALGEWRAKIKENFFLQVRRIKSQTLEVASALLWILQRKSKQALPFH